MNRFLQLDFALVIFLAAATPVLADGAAPSGAQPSENFKKSERFLPGEEVVSPTGQKMKVWSTEGPVPVSRVPEPFDDPDSADIDEINVIVDTDSLRHKRRGKRRKVRPNSEDSFQIPPGAPSDRR